MLPNSEFLISDTSCLILLNKIDELSLLKKFGLPVLITSELSKLNDLQFAKSHANS